MYQCPKCNNAIPEKFESFCPVCKGRLSFCSSCQAYTERQWHKSTLSLMPRLACQQFFATCRQCGEEIWDSRHLRKSGLYQHFRFSFKFVNRYTIPYAMYFHHQFPFGEEMADLGLCVNTFVFKEEANERRMEFGKTDFGPVRAYWVTNRIGTQTEENIALSHESGLEVFPPRVANHITRRTAMHPLHQSLALIEAQINWWWERYKSDYWGPSKVVSFHPLVERIAVRTTDWEFSMDDRFLQKDREAVAEHIASVTQPAESIEEFAAAFDQKTLRKKILDGSKKIVRVM